MNTNFNSADNFNELLFENKNKAYGAYAIRKSQNDNISISLLVTTAFFGLIVLLTFALTKTKDIIPDFDVNDPDIFISSVEIELPKPIEKPKVKVPETVKSTSGVFVASKDPQKTDLQTNDNQNLNKNPNPLGTKDSADTETPGPKLPEVPAKKPEVLKFVDKMPKLDNMAQFIADNLKYPVIARENGTAGTVYLTFVVEVDGSISDIKLLQGIGDGCEQEAMRVVAMMPKWEPGTLKEIPQRVQCSLPIRFRLK